MRLLRSTDNRTSPTATCKLHRRWWGCQLADMLLNPGTPKEVLASLLRSGLLWRALTSVLLCFPCVMPAAAQSRPGYTVVSDAITIVVRRDFSHVEEHTRVVRVLEPEAVKELSARTLVYKGGQEDLQVLSAWTRLPDGSRHGNSGKRPAAYAPAVGSYATLYPCKAPPVTMPERLVTIGRNTHFVRRAP